MTKHTECAKMVRNDLKKAFPGIKFSVTSSIFSGGNSVDISWTDGPSSKQVNEVVKKYQYGHFDGMQDMYEYSNSREDISQVKYVMTQRKLSESVIKQFVEKFKVDYDINEPVEDLNRGFEWNGQYTSWFNIAWRELQDIDLTGGLK